MNAMAMITACMARQQGEAPAISTTRVNEGEESSYRFLYQPSDLGRADAHRDLSECVTG
jgi:hypothetical protein